LIPLRIEEVLPCKSLQYFIGPQHWLDAWTPPLEQHLHRLTGTIKVLLSKRIEGFDASGREPGLKLPPEFAGGGPAPAAVEHPPAAEEPSTAAAIPETPGEIAKGPAPAAEEPPPRREPDLKPQPEPVVGSPAPAAVEQPPVAPRAETPVEIGPSPPRKSLIWVVSLVGLLVVLGVVGGIWLWSQEPKTWEAYYDRGFSHHKKQQYDLAISDYSKAIDLNPRAEYAYLNRGNLYYGKKQYDLAIADYNKVIELNQDPYEAYLGLGAIYIRKDNYEIAIVNLSKAIDLKAKLADVVKRDSDYGKQIQYDLAVAYNNRGFAFLLMGEYNEAERDIKKALEFNSDLIDAIMSMAELYSVTRKTEYACKWLKKGIEKGYKDWDYIKTSETFHNIRNSPCYKELMTGR
jgi:Flp pilus assembly protein TadD